MDYWFHGLPPYVNLGIFDKGVVRQVQLKELYSATDALPSDWVLTLEDHPDTTPYVDKLTLTLDPNVRGLVTGNPIEYGGFNNVTELVVYDGEGNLIIRQQLQFGLEQEGTVIFKYANATDTTMFEILQVPRPDSPVTGRYWASIDPVYDLPYKMPAIGTSVEIWPNPQGNQSEGELRIRPAMVGGKYAIGTLSIRAAVSELVDFGTANITINSSHLTKVPATLPPTISSIELMADNLNDPSIVNWKIEDTQITSMRSMFKGCASFNQPIGHWNVSNVTDMTALFAGCSSFNQPLNDWDVSKVVLFENMFDTATVFDQPLDKWVTQTAVTMNGMFYNAVAFNQDISGWEVDNVGFMENMFQGATLFNQDLSGWCVGKVVESSKSNWASPAMTPEQIPVWGTCPNGPVRNYTLTIDGPNSKVNAVPAQFTHTFEVAGVPGTTNKTEWKVLFGTGKITNTGLLTTTNYVGKITLVLVVTGVYSAFREINVPA